MGAKIMTNSEQRTANSEQRTANSEQRTANSEQRTNSNLTKAKNAKNDEFYTQYHDIEKEINAYLDYDENVFRDKTLLLPCDDPEWSNFTKYFAQNFERFGLKKLISTSYAHNSKHLAVGYTPSLFESDNPQFDQQKTLVKGKIFTLCKDTTQDGRIDIHDLQWTYLEGDGDFRSEEVKALRDQADMIITNPPFSLFREFLKWIVEGGKQFVIIGNKNCVTYKEVFPLIKANKMWSGRTEWSGGMWFETKDESDVDRVDDGINMKNVSSVWFTNFEHGRRHQPLQLMTLQDNLRFNKKMKGKTAYDHYDNYDAIEVSFTDAIPSDYTGVMGVPISFLDKYCPEQFEILGITQRNDDPFKTKKYTTEQYTNANDLNARGVIIMNGSPKSMFARILVKHKDATQ
jgi:hypothetical protein